MGGAATISSSSLAARAASAAPPPPRAAPPPTTLRVGPAHLPSLAAALDQATASTSPDPITILIEPGVYRERVVIPATSPPIKLLALTSAADEGAGPALASLASMGKGGALGLASPPTVTLAWATTRPYESVVDVAAPRCALAGVRVDHASPSIANNAAVLVREGGSLTLQACGLTSSTGNGLAVEGAAAADGCDLSGCKHGFGAAAFGESLVLTRCAVTGNGRGGVLARGVACLSVSGCAVTKNGGPGLDLAAGGEGCGGAAVAVGCDLAGNAGGRARIGDGWAGGGVE